MSRVSPLKFDTPKDCSADNDIVTSRRVLIPQLALNRSSSSVASKKVKFPSIATANGCQISEIFSVSGAITATIGALTAISGVFPNNQTQIRLYLECLGCAMVILGTLIIFISQRLRANNQRRAHHRRHLMWQQFNMRHNNNEELQQSIELTSSQWLPKRIDAKDEIIQIVDAIPKQQQQQNDLELFVVDENGVTNEIAISLDAENNDANNDADDDDDDDDDDGEEVDGAAIEAALSIVLSAATLAGFRSSSMSQQKQQLQYEVPAAAAATTTTTSGRNNAFSEEQKRTASMLLVTCLPNSLGSHDHNESNIHGHHCCLHHAVQHKLSARKWIKRLDSVRHSDGSHHIVADQQNGTNFG